MTLEKKDKDMDMLHGRPFRDQQYDSMHSDGTRITQGSLKEAPADDYNVPSSAKQATPSDFHILMTQDR